MTLPPAAPSIRELELLGLVYGYVLEHGLSELSLRPLAAAVGSSPRVLLFLFGSKDELVRRVLEKARAEELAVLPAAPGSLAETAAVVWTWLAEPAHAPVLRIWVEAYARSLTHPDGPWSDFARTTVADWLETLAGAQPRRTRRSAAARDQRTAVLAVLRGGLLDLLATGESRRVDGAVRAALATLAC